MKNKIFLLILILMILFITIFILNKFSNSQKIDDILFLKLFSNEDVKIKETETTKVKYEKIYNFKINYKNMDFKTIDLADTIDKKTLVQEKIAPGTSGSFNILLETNQNLNYKITFNSKNEKPKNLNFRASKNEKILGEANTLEELSEKLVGFISKNEKIDITINWYWAFENEEKLEDTDIQDTKDAENIKSYQFDMYAIGEEIV